MQCCRLERRGALPTASRGPSPRTEKGRASLAVVRSDRRTEPYDVDEVALGVLEHPAKDLAGG